ncbi:hypothetical protein [Neobacillus sp. YIM B06451]|uniref:hypothetical protein n=1 Tax=Neobacillus sp. YIM B06451 TaxID=3070994 RepID=UPI00292FE528|nr:hypothetical protein [Neobacillus sp. YIM B06451]
MCVSNHAFEMQSYKLSEEIRRNSIYTPVAVVCSGGERVNFGNQFVHPDGFIEKVVLQDKEGNDFEVEPSENGLRFAKGEISYNDYQRLQKKDDRKAIALFAGAAGSFFIIGWGFLHLFG